MRTTNRFMIDVDRYVDKFHDSFAASLCFSRSFSPGRGVGTSGRQGKNCAFKETLKKSGGHEMTTDGTRTDLPRSPRLA
jgi:hypothetical protein